MTPLTSSIYVVLKSFSDRHQPPSLIVAGEVVDSKYLFKGGHDIKCLIRDGYLKVPTSSEEIYHKPVRSIATTKTVNVNEVIPSKQTPGIINQIVNTSINVTDYEINAQVFYSKQPFYFDKSGLFWFWDTQQYTWVLVDEIDVMNALTKNLSLQGQTVTSFIKTNYLEAFRRVGRLNLPKEPKKSWIQFKNTVYDYATKETFQASPEYFFCNPIPFNIGQHSNTPLLDKLFIEWAGEEHQQTLYELLAYCCITDYPIQLIFCLIGTGRNGKTQFLRLLNKFLGENNVCGTELDDLLSSRFEKFKLYRKLACTMGETNFGAIEKSSLLKRLVGGDRISFEMKGKQAFDKVNYAKIIMATNGVPPSNDKSDGYYRRWFIINFPNEFEEGKDILSTIPDSEYEALSHKVTNLLPELLARGSFTYQGSIEARKRSYLNASNPLPEFLSDYCEFVPNTFILWNDLYMEYVLYLRKMKRRSITRKEFAAALLEEGHQGRYTSRKVGDDYVYGVYVEHLCVRSSHCSPISISPSRYRVNEYENGLQSLSPLHWWNNQPNIMAKCHNCELLGNFEEPCREHPITGSILCHQCALKLQPTQQVFEETVTNKTEGENYELRK